jgi:SH3 domain protein
MYLPIKTSLVFFLIWAAFTVPSIAESKYVDEKFELPLRTGPAGDRKIIALIPAGQQVQIINKDGEWSEVSLPNGRQGFVLDRYLTDRLPSALVLERLQQRHSTLQARSEELQKRAGELEAENKQLKEILSKTEADLSGLTSEHEVLRQGSEEYLSLREKYEQTVKELIEVRSKAEKFESEVNKLSHREFYDGMLYGGGILVFGLFLGVVFRRPKRKQGLM